MKDKIFWEIGRAFFGEKDHPQFQRDPDPLRGENNGGMQDLDADFRGRENLGGV